MDLNGVVASVWETHFDAVVLDGSIRKGKPAPDHSSTLTVFNKSGNKQEIFRYNANGNLDYKWVFRYNPEGIVNKKFRYANNGKILNKLVLSYDKKGRKIGETWYHPDGSLDAKWTFRYDTNGNKIRETWYQHDGKIGYWNAYQYDSQGNKIEEIWYKSHDSLAYKETFRYDNQKHLVEAYKWYLPYSSNFVKITYQYGLGNNVVKVTRYLPNGGVDFKETYQYVFDKQGNWVQKIKFVNDVPKIITVRKIKYFGF